MSAQVRGRLAVVYLALCLILGGASAAGAIANAVLQALGLMIILLLMWSRRFAIPAGARPLAYIGGGSLLWVLLSLLPLPINMWEALPGRAEIAQALRRIGVTDANLPVSLAPDATISSLLWLLPVAAMFLLAVTLSWDQRRNLAGTILLLGALSVFLGIFQLFGGGESPLLIYELTSGGPVGFFSNINHQATLILCSFPCAAVFAARNASSTDRSKRSGGLIMAAALSFFLAIGLALAGSLAGYGLFIPAALGSLLIYLRSGAARVAPLWKGALALVTTIAIALAFVGPFNQQSLSSKLDGSPTSRATIAVTSTHAIAEYFPIGSGLGTFPTIFRRFEDPKQGTREYVNHAHNDYLEVAAELGLVGVIAIAFFLVWWLRRSVVAWLSDLPGMRIARSGTVIIGVILLHSLVDYPIRTAAIAAIFAVACAFLVPPTVRPGQRHPSNAASLENLKHLQAQG